MSENTQLTSENLELNKDSNLDNKVAEQNVISEKKLNETLIKLADIFKKHLANKELELSKQSNMTKKDWLQIIIMPFVLIFFTAIIGGLFATWFQDRSFRQNTLFQAQYERLLTSQKETSAQYQDLSRLLDILESSENVARSNNSFCSANNFNPLIEQLKQFENRRLGLKDYSKESENNKILENALNNYSQKLAESIKCESNFIIEDCRNDCKQKSIELRDALQKTVFAHNDLINNLINQNK
jgi:hypothetical protein